MVYRAALRCTISILRIWSLWLGLHTAEQYSRFDLTILKYAFALVYEQLNFMLTRVEHDYSFITLGQLLTKFAHTQFVFIVRFPRHCLCYIAPILFPQLFLYGVVGVLIRGIS